MVHKPQSPLIRFCLTHSMLFVCLFFHISFQNNPDFSQNFGYLKNGHVGNKGLKHTCCRSWQMGHGCVSSPSPSWPASLMPCVFLTSAGISAGALPAHLRPEPLLLSYPNPSLASLSLLQKASQNKFPNTVWSFLGQEPVQPISCFCTACKLRMGVRFSNS